MAIKDIKGEIVTALQSGDADQFAAVMDTFSADLEDKILAQAQATGNSQEAIAQATGINLTGEERTYFMELIQQPSSSQNAFAGVADDRNLVPATVINRIFDGLKKEHKLLGLVDSQTIGIANEWIFSIGVTPAQWGKLCSNLQEITDKGFRKISLGLFKLTAYLPVCKALLELNEPAWLAQYVITLIQESIEAAIEIAIVDGTGKEQPIGMRRSIENASAGTHTVKTAVEIEGLTPKVMGEIMAKLSKIEVETGVTVERTVQPSEVSIVVNPQTYWKEIFPMTTTQMLNGQFVQNLPLPFSIVQVPAVPEGELVVGVAKDYFFGIGKDTTIGFSDEVKYIEDERVYAGKFYGNGTPKFEDAFTIYKIKAAAAGTGAEA